MTLRADTLANDSILCCIVAINDIIFDNVVANAKRSKVDVNEMKRDHFTTLLLKKTPVPTLLLQYRNLTEKKTTMGDTDCTSLYMLVFILTKEM